MRVKATRSRRCARAQRMLAFARRQERRAESVAIATPLVAGMMELLQRSLGPTFAIETAFPADLPPVAADINQLEMALLNLAVNARDAMGRGVDGHDPRRGSRRRARRGDQILPRSALCSPDRCRTTAAEWTAKPSRVRPIPSSRRRASARNRPRPLDGPWFRASRSAGRSSSKAALVLGTEAHIWLPLQWRRTPERTGSRSPRRTRREPRQKSSSWSTTMPSS